VQQTPQRKQGMGVCSAMVISFPSRVLIIAFSVDIVLRRLVMSFFNSACPEWHGILRFAQDDRISVY
jgi:hypothetical protein